MSLNLFTRRSVIGLHASSSLNRQLYKPLASLHRHISLIPQPPGYIVGTVNDAYVPPPVHKTHGSYHWTGERIVTIAMVPLLVLPIVTGNAYGLLDGVLSGLLIIHAHAGFQSCIIDYIPKRVYGVLHNYAMYLLTLGSLVSAYGVYSIETKEEGGLAGIVKRLFKA